MSTYPTGVKSFGAVNDGDTITDEMFEEAYDEVNAIENGLINGLDHPLRLAAATEYTISSGAITVAKGYIAIDTEADAASDDLATITAGSNVGEGSIIICRAENTARVVTLKDGSGNLLLNGDYALSATDRTITLIYDGSNWRELARSVPIQQEGSWTPVVGGSGGTSGQTYASQVGRYLKIGRLVVATFTVELSTKGTITTSVQIQGLPFTATALAGLNSPASLMWLNMATNMIQVTAQVGQGSTAATVYGTTAAASGSFTARTTTDINDNTLLNGTFVYFTD